MSLAQADILFAANDTKNSNDADDHSSIDLEDMNGHAGLCADLELMSFEDIALDMNSYSDPEEEEALLERGDDDE